MDGAVAASGDRVAARGRRRRARADRCDGTGCDRRPALSADHAARRPLGELRSRRAAAIVRARAWCCACRTRATPFVTPLGQAAADVDAFCKSEALPFCFIGGLAVQRWGVQRLTHDVDITLVTGFGEEAPFIDKLLSRFAERLPDARAFALEHRVLLLQAANGVPIDVALGAMPLKSARWCERARSSSSRVASSRRAAPKTCSCTRCSPVATKTGWTPAASSRDEDRSSTWRSCGASCSHCLSSKTTPRASHVCEVSSLRCLNNASRRRRHQAARATRVMDSA